MTRTTTPTSASTAVPGSSGFPGFDSLRLLVYCFIEAPALQWKQPVTRAARRLAAKVGVNTAAGGGAALLAFVGATAALLWSDGSPWWWVSNCLLALGVLTPLAAWAGSRGAGLMDRRRAIVH